MNNSNSKYVNFLRDLNLTKDFSGIISTNKASSIVYSTDNSIYQWIPKGVIKVKKSLDIISCMKLASEYKSIAISMRGGGTGTNGQFLSKGIILDTKTHLNKILDLNIEEGWVKVQPGIICDHLNQFLKKYNVFFAPNISTSSRATIGGMINTDACGKGSTKYGRTSDHIISLKLVLSDGSIWETKEMTFDELKTLTKENSKKGFISSQIYLTCITHQNLIKTKFHDHIRFTSGYNLRKTLDFNTKIFRPQYLFSGSEGTLGFLSEAKLKLTPIPKYYSLIIISYPSFNDMLSTNLELFNLNPCAIEMMDETLLSFAKQDYNTNQLMKLLSKPGKAINLIEITNNNLMIFKEQIEKITKWCNSQSFGIRITEDPFEISKWWTIRKNGVGLLGRMQGPKKPIAFIEDSAVPIKYLPKYLTEIQRIFKEFNLKYGIYGHADSGCVHVRPALNLMDHLDQKKLKTISDEVFKLTKSLDGVLWGEHGRGFRSEYTQEYFGNTIYKEFQKIKNIADPNCQMNPGNIVQIKNSHHPFKTVINEFRDDRNKNVSPNNQNEFKDSFNCNGNSTCLSLSDTQIMCPSYQVSNNLLLSPKGRADLLREFARVDSLKLNKTKEIKIFLDDIYNSLNSCLSCKGCTNQCPLRVNIPSMKSKFLNIYFQKYKKRKLKDYLIAYSENIFVYMNLFPNLIKFSMSNNISKFFIKKICGLTALPIPKLLLSHTQIPKSLYIRNPITKTKNTIVIIQDSWTSIFQPNILIDTISVIKSLNYQVKLIPLFVNGKSMHIKGFNEEFKKLVKKNIKRINNLIPQNTEVIGIDPSIVLTYRDEYEEFRENDSKLNNKILLLQEWLINQKLIKKQKSSYILFPHCHEKQLSVKLDTLWKVIFEKLGQDLEIPKIGCCGMAGIFGHEIENLDMSKKIYNYSWKKKILNTKTTALATGFSCRHQISRFSSMELKHPIEIIKALVK